MNVLPRLVLHGVMVACALGSSFAAQIPPPPPPSDISRQLAAKIAAAVAPFDEVRLLRVRPDTAGAGQGQTGPVSLDAAPVRDAEMNVIIRTVRELLRASSLRTVEQPSNRTAEVRVSCSENLRDRVCAAEVRKGDASEAVFVTGPRAQSEDTTGPLPSAVLDIRPLLAGRLPILDVAETGERLLVLDAGGLALHEPGEQGLKATARVPIGARRPWPRDLRGRLLIEDRAIAAFLPGVTCRGTTEPLTIRCTEGQDAWPGGPPSSVLESTANSFTAPGTPPFFTAAAVDAGWLLAGVDARLHVVNQATGARDTWPGPGIGDDIADLKSPCAASPLVIASVEDGDDESHGALRAYRAADRGLVPLTPAASLPGRLTALWSHGTFVLAVAHNADSGRYEAFRVGMSCAR